MCEKCRAARREALAGGAKLPESVELNVKLRFPDGEERTELSAYSLYESGQMAVEVNGGAEFLLAFLETITPGLQGALQEIVDGKIKPRDLMPRSSKTLQ